MKRTVLLFALCGTTIATTAQDTLTTFDRQVRASSSILDPGKSKFMLRGYYHAGFEAVNSANESVLNFAGGQIAPILMFKQSDRLFFESEFEGGFEDGEFEWGLEYADIAYVLNKSVTVRAGKFILPFGIYMEKLHPAWIDRLAVRPLGYGHDGLAPSSDVGVELRGARHLGKTKWNYQLYLVNGPQLKEGDSEPDEAGMLSFGYQSDNNNNKAVGGRLGLQPFVNSSLEIGGSFLTGNPGSAGSLYEETKMVMYAADLSLVQPVSGIGSVLDFKGQLNGTWLDRAYYPTEEDEDILYTFENSSMAYFGQLSVRPSLVSNDIIRKLELVGRFSKLSTPEGSLWEQQPTQTSIGLNYWLDWRTVIKIGYVNTEGMEAGHGATGEPTSLIYAHWAVGF